MKSVVLQTIAAVSAAAVFVAIKTLAMPAYITYPVLSVSIGLALFGLAAANSCGRKGGCRGRRTI